MEDDVNEKGLFRTEVFESRRNRNYGSVLINTPVQYTVLTIGFSVLIGGIFLFLIFGEFSEKFVVKGYLESTKGVARIFPNKNGVIEKCFIKQGDKVKKGASLFLIDTSYEGLGKSKLHEVLTHLEMKKRTLQDEMELKEKQLHALEPLLQKKFIPLITYQTKHDELIALEHQVNSVEVEIINHKHSESYVIRSPIDGIISSVIYQEGQYTNFTKPLMKILPLHADLMAQLFIPVPQSGFLRHDNKIIIRYDAYPYARFGTSKAMIHEISRSVLTDNEEEKPIRIGAPYYKISALLEKQFVTVYGKDKKLQHGMTISAVIVGAKRKIWQCIFDPLYRFYGGVFL